MHDLYQKIREYILDNKEEWIHFIDLTKLFIDIIYYANLSGCIFYLIGSVENSNN